MRHLLVAIGFGLAFASPAIAQLESHVIVNGLSSPVAFVQDPSLPDTQYVVEQGGRIRTILNGDAAAPDFLDLRGNISSGGERGLLGLAFAPDYATSGRFFVDFTNLNGDTVVARYRRSAANPRQSDPSSRFDLRWPDGQRFIAQPYSNHNGGNLQFGPDGDLYIGLGDGGSGNDPEDRAQTPSTLLGKMLRINVNVSDADPEGYDVPPDNPFVGQPGYLAEIWAFGLRNPWRYTFDMSGPGATGALIIGDVGQNSFEEVDYEPSGRGGRNYGWRSREGAHDNITSPPPAYLPLTDPIYDYGRTLGATVVGGYVYRGAALPAAYRGRYFFADFVSGRVWSMGLSIDDAGEAIAAGIQEHTAELGGANALGNISSFGLDANGELYLVGYSAGEIRRISSPSTVRGPAIVIDTPGAGSVAARFSIAGWAADFDSTSGTGVDAVHVWAYPASGAPHFVGGASYGVRRPDLGTLFGSRFTNAGWTLTGTGLAHGPWTLVAFAHSTVTGTFRAVTAVSLQVESGTIVVLDAPPAGHVVSPFALAGWAVDLAAFSGAGISAIHVWAIPVNGDPPIFAGVASYGVSRPDVGAALGNDQLAQSGYQLTVALPVGTYDLVAFAQSAVTGTFDGFSVVRIEVGQSTP
jgi:glucose/arabinose dehydrogenase